MIINIILFIHLFIMYIYLNIFYIVNNNKLLLYNKNKYILIMAISIQRIKKKYSLYNTL